MYKLIAKITSKPVTEETLTDLFSVVCELEDRQEVNKWCKWIRQHCKQFTTPAMYDLYYRTYRLEAMRGDFDAYCIYLERKRPAEERFYLPRRRVLKVLVDDLQDLFDGKIKFLGISLPPRVGKLLSDDTPVMTTKGWKTHGELKVGDYVFNHKGEPVRVETIGDKHYANKRVHFSNGDYIDCHDRHEWVVSDGSTVETNNLKVGDGLINNYATVISIEDIPHKQGNCIQVEGGIYCAGKTMLPTHNSTLGIIFMTFVMGHRPEIANVMSGFSDKLTEGFYNEILSIITDDEKYCWNEVFQGVEIVNKSAKNETIDLNSRKRFSTMTCRSVTGTLTGAVEIGNGGILYCDDLIEDLEESLNIDRLNNKYDAYLNQLKDRKKNRAFELMVGTRWNVFDPLGRIQSQYENNPQYRFRVIPALNENDESNFIYDYELGFSTEYYHDMRASIDPATWWAKYMGSPYIREGLLLPESELQYYNGVLPDGKPDYKCFVCDVAFGGGDYVSMPIAYVYGETAFIHDVVFDNGDKTVTKPIVIGKLKQHMPSFGRFEANNGGDAYAEDVNRMLREENVRINITSKKAPNNKSKLARIIQYAPDIKQFYFRDRQNRSAEYNKFMINVTTFTQDGKNKNDDAIHRVAMLA